MATQKITVIKEPTRPVTVRQTSNSVEVDTTVNHVHIVTPGPQGPEGPPGSGTGGDFYFTQNFSSQADWIVNHNLHAYPNVQAIVGGEEIEADVTHNSLNSLTVHFAVPTSGTVWCS